MKHLPSYKEIDGLPIRAFFFGVLEFLRPEYLSGLIKHANRVRNREKEKESKETILIRADIYAKLEAESFYSSKYKHSLSNPCSL